MRLKIMLIFMLALCCAACASWKEHGYHAHSKQATEVQPIWLPQDMHNSEVKSREYYPIPEVVNKNEKNL